MKRIYKTLGMALLSLSLALPVVAKFERMPAPDTARAQQMINANKEAFRKIFPTRNISGNVLPGGGDRLVTISGQPNVNARPSAATRSIEEPRGNIYALCPTGRENAGFHSYADAFWGKIDIANGNVTRIFNGRNYAQNSETEYDLQSGAVKDGILYIPDYTQNMVTGEVNAYWKRIDIETGEFLEPKYMGDNFDSFCYSLTYVPEQQAFYALGINMNTSEKGILNRYDTTTDTWTPYFLNNVGGTAGEFMSGLVYCPADGNLYGITDGGMMYSIDLLTGDTTLVKEFDTFDEYFAVPETDANHAITYSPLDHAFVSIYRNMAEDLIQVVYIPLEEDGSIGLAVLGPELSHTVYVSTLYCPDPYAEDEAPAIPVLSAPEFNKAELNGKVTFTVPEVLYNGLAITASSVNTRVLIDSKEAYNKDLRPGATETLDLNLTEGLHDIQVICTLDGKTSPVARKSFYVGNDIPCAPTDIKVNTVDSTITWTAPGELGANDGYVDTSVLTYDVYFDGKKQNTADITGTSFSFTVPEKFGNIEVSVVAKANGKSSDSGSVKKIFGKALSLPISLTPTAEDAELVQVYDANHDGTAFERIDIKGYEPFFGFDFPNYIDRPDDWIFLPLANFPSTETVYQIQFMYMNRYNNDRHLGDLDVYIGREATPEAMTQSIYSHAAKCQITPELISTIFPVSEAGDYYVGIHTGSVPPTGTTNYFRGIRLYDIQLSALDTPVTVPGNPTDLKVAAADFGELFIDVEATLPTVDLVGEPLDASKELTLKLETFLGEDPIDSVVLKGMPGQKVNGRVEVGEPGNNAVYITPSSAIGSGVRINRRVYVGPDAPMAPTNVKGVASEDNLSITLTWDAPDESQNGGYLNKEGLTYEIYTASGISNSRVGVADGMSYTYNYGNRAQAAIFIGPIAKNEIGQSANNTFIHEFIGKPYELPMVEEFPLPYSSLSPWQYNTSGCMWEKGSSIETIGLNASNGLLYSHNNGEVGGWGQVYPPKFTTKGANNPALHIRYYDYSETPEIEVLIRSNKDPELKVIDKFEPQRPLKGEWADYDKILPAEYHDCGWVQVQLRITMLKSATSYCVLDRFEINQHIDYDFKANGVTGPDQAFVGETPEFYATVTNSGIETVGGTAKVELIGGDRVLDHMDYTIRQILSSDDHMLIPAFQMKKEYADYDELTVRLTAISNDDEVAHNNVCEYKFRLIDSVIPAVSNLNGKWNDDHSAVTLSWDQPSTEYGTIETFENYNAWNVKADRIGPWKNIDKDGLVPFVFEQFRFDDDTLPGAWMVFDSHESGAEADEHFKGHSGDKILIARSIAYDQYSEEPTAAEDWLISPEVVGGTKVSFWFGISSATYTETVELLYSSTDDETSSFKHLYYFSKSGSELWEQCEWTLPADAKYFALKYKSIGHFVGLLDDIEYTPATPQNWEIAGYEVWRRTADDWSDFQCVSGPERLTTTTFTDPLGDKNARYYIVTYVKTEAGDKYGPRSNEFSVYSTGINDGLDAGSAIYGDKGFAVINGHAGETARIFTTDGACVARIALASDAEKLPLDPAVYVISIGNTTAKIIVR